MHLPQHFFDASWLKSVTLSLVIGGLGWTAHTLLTSDGNARLLTEHTQQLEKLAAGQEKTADALQNMAVTITRIDGKLDTVNQKIDDDRRALRAERNSR